ncbi:MAG: LysM peptidoglycan-binding domain-containing protein [Nitrospiraceae bacterium]|nr:MAG: LysM peptidoglycan-binding domain-containing protein [Nitrospiraceae bacterium]
MKVSYFKHIIFVLGILGFGCSVSSSQVVSNSGQLTAAPRHVLSMPDNKGEGPAVVSLNNLKKGKELSSIDVEGVEAVTENIKEHRSVIAGNDLEISQREDSNLIVDEESENNAARDQAMLDAALDYCETAQEFWTGGNHEKAIESLDEAYQLVLNADTDKYPELIQQKEDLRFTISKRIMEIYSLRFTTVNGNHKEIPLTMNEYVEREIRSFQGYERELFLEGYKRSGRYREEIVKSLKEAGLPEELSWLPFIESWFKVKALSPARALGIWQFIPSTGYKFGLKRDTWIDERMDPRKATAAAIAYLKELHQMFGDWTTVLAAYNCGEGNVLRVIRGQKVNYLDNFWDLYERLPRETARYVPRFLATLHIMKDPGKYGFTFDQLDSPPFSESVLVEKQIRLKDMAEGIGVPADELAALNPELRRQATPPAKYYLNIPAGTGSVLLAKLDTIPNWTPQKNEYAETIYHTVKKGETLSRIAVKYRTTVNAIVKVNKISRKRNLRIGQKLKIPLRGGKGGDLLSYEDDQTQGNKYRAKRGDTLRTIAKKFNTNTTHLKKLNHLTSALLYEGQVLRVAD